MLYRPRLVSASPTLGRNHQPSRENGRFDIYRRCYGWQLRVPTATYLFTLTGSNTTRFFVNGSRVSAATSLAAGTYTIQARFVLDTTSIVPASVLASINSGPTIPLDPSNLTHDESNLKPLINSNVPTSGSPLGGDSVTISGIGFFPSNSITVHWGNTNLTGQRSPPRRPQSNWSPRLAVRQRRGHSTDTQRHEQLSLLIITSKAWYRSTSLPHDSSNGYQPDPRCLGTGWAALCWLDYGNITIYTFADDYTVTNAQVVTTIAGLSNPSILGITFNPRIAKSCQSLRRPQSPLRRRWRLFHGAGAL